MPSTGQLRVRAPHVRAQARGAFMNTVAELYFFWGGGGGVSRAPTSRPPRCERGEDSLAQKTSYIYTYSAHRDAPHNYGAKKQEEEEALQTQTPES